MDKKERVCQKVMISLKCHPGGENEGRDIDERGNFV